MASLENVERLRQRANISYDEAKTALDANGDDLLEAMIYLERLGRVVTPPQEGYYSTQQPPVYAHPGAEHASSSAGRGGFHSLFKRLWKWFVELLRKGNRNSFQVCRQNETLFQLPITVLVVLICCCFWCVVPLLIVGLFFDYRYRFQGPDFSKETANAAMDRVAKAAEDIKQEVSQLAGLENKE